MNFDQWLQAEGFDPAKLTPELQTALQAAHAACATGAAIRGSIAVFETWLRAAHAGSDPATLNPQERMTRSLEWGDALQAARRTVAPATNPAPTPLLAGTLATVPAGTVAQPLQAGAGQGADMMSLFRAEHERVMGIGRVCAGQHEEIRARAVTEGWTIERAELEVLRAARSRAPAGFVINNEPTPEILEAALCSYLRIPNVEKDYSDQVLSAAHKNYRHIGLQQLILTAAAMAGHHVGPGMRITQSNFYELLKAAFSSNSLPGILSNVANKELLAGFLEEDMSCMEIAAIKPVNDFKQVTSYRLNDNMEYEEVGPGGEIKHGETSEESYTRQAKTYAKMFSLTRTDVINDDLGALDDLRTRLGAGASRKLNRVFWTRFLANSAHFTTALGNYIEGATTTLLVDGVGLEQAVLKFRKMKDATGKVIGGRPSILLVPPEREFVADKLYVSANVNTGGAATAESVPNENIHARKYRPVVSPFLSDATLTGNSTTAWFLLRDPRVLAAIVISFLFGNRTPTVESAETTFDTLGIQFRGYHDFGVDLAETLAGVKSKGAA